MMWIALHGWGAPLAYLKHLDRKLNGGYQRFLRARWVARSAWAYQEGGGGDSAVYTVTPVGAWLEHRRALRRRPTVSHWIEKC